jgi:hypothetical protein
MYTKAETEEKLSRAARRLLETQPTLFEFTDATRQSEWNIANHFATELDAEFPGYHRDTDVIKPGFGNMRPDVIIHERKTHKRNLLVVEVKRDKADITADLEKLRNHWFNHPLRYRFGASVVINASEPPFVKVLENAAPPNLE